MARTSKGKTTKVKEASLLDLLAELVTAQQVELEGCVSCQPFFRIRIAGKGKKGKGGKGKGRKGKGHGKGHHGAEKGLGVGNPVSNSQEFLIICLL